jgi:hypothetical protein
MPDMNLPAGLSSFSLAETGTAANTGDNVKNAGMAFGELVKQVGAAVATTQLRLNEITRDTAKALAENHIEVIAARQKIYNDDGTLSGENAVSDLVMKMPLASYVDVVNHEVAQVHLQGVFQSNGFTHKGQSSSSTSWGSSAAQLHIGAPLSSGPSTATALARGAAATENGTSGPRSGYQVTNETQSAYGYRQQSSFGQVRMNAEIRPRTDIGVPKPPQVIRGPELTLIPGPGGDTKGTATVGGEEVEVTVGRWALLQINYRRRPSIDATDTEAGKGIEGKSFAIEAPGLSWAACTRLGVVPSVNEDSTAAQREAAEALLAQVRETDENGDLFIRVYRDLTRDTPDAPAAHFVVTARIGMIHTSTVVSL